MRTGIKIIGARHGEKLFETLMTKEELVRAEDMGDYYRVTPDERGLNYDKYLASYGSVTQMEEAYTSHNTNRLDVDGTVAKILTTEYVNKELKGEKAECR